MSRTILVTALGVLLSVRALAQAPATPQRPTFTAGTATTAPGTVELEFGVTLNDRLLVLPTTVKFTPDVPRGLWRRAEVSLSFDALAAVSEDGRRVSRFGDRLVVALRRPVYEGRRLTLAVSPHATVWLRGPGGARLGVTGLAASRVGRGALAVNVTATAATSPSAGNAKQQYDAALDYAIPLGNAGRWSRVEVFAGMLSEHARGQPAALSFAQGLSVRVRPHLVLDVAVFQTGLRGPGARDTLVLAGLVVNLGRIP